MFLRFDKVEPKIQVSENKNENCRFSAELTQHIEKPFSFLGHVLEPTHVVKVVLCNPELQRTSGGVVSFPNTDLVGPVRLDVSTGLSLWSC